MSGGGHWGGGMFINAWDMARFGYLFLRNGKWNDRQIVSEKWIQMARTPGPANKDVRLRELVSEHRPQAAAPNAPASAVCFVGNGSNIIYIDWEQRHRVRDQVDLNGARSLNEIVGKLIAANRDAPRVKDGQALSHPER